MASRIKEGIKEFFSSKDDLDYPDDYHLQHRVFTSPYGRNTLVPVFELKVPLCCDNCERKVKESLEEIDGVKDVVCDRESQRVTVTGFVDPDKALRRVKKVKKHSEFFSDNTYINRTSQLNYSPRLTSRPVLPLESEIQSRYLHPMDTTQTRYVTNPYIRTHPHDQYAYEGRMVPQPRALVRVNSYDRRMSRQPSFGRVERYDNRRQNALVPVEMQRDFYEIRRMPSFNKHRYHDAEFISMGNEYTPSMAETRYVSHHSQRPSMYRTQVSFSKLPVMNPHYFKHIESEYD